MLEKARTLTYVLFAYLNIDTEPFFILMVLMCVDSFVGAVKAVRLGYRFSFKRLMIGFTLKLCFLIIPLIIALMGRQLGYDFHYAVSITLSILSISEMYSILGNIYTAKNKIELDKLDVISEILITLRYVLRRALYNILNRFDNNFKK